MSAPVPGDLAAILARQESSRKQTLRGLRKKALFQGILVGLAGLVLITFLAESDDYSAIILFPLLFGGGATYYNYQRLAAAFTNALKSETIPVLLHDIDPSLTYQATGSIPQEDFKAVQLFKSKWTSYAAQDLIAGKIGETKLRLCMLKLEYTRPSMVKVDDTTDEVTETLFEGLLFAADFNKHFSAQTFINQETDSLISGLLAKNIELEDPEFNRLFTVRSSDEVEARYLLSPSLMERFKQLRSRGKFRAAFSNGSLWLMLEMPMDAFSPDVSKPLTDSTQTVRVMENLVMITGLVEELGLNTRIWSKA